MPDPKTLGECVDDLRVVLQGASELLDLKSRYDRQTKTIRAMQRDLREQAQGYTNTYADLERRFRDERTVSANALRRAADAEAKVRDLEAKVSDLRAARRLTDQEHEATVASLLETIRVYKATVQDLEHAKKPKKQLRKALIRIDEQDDEIDRLNEMINEQERQLGIYDRAGVDILDIVEQARRNIDIN